MGFDETLLEILAARDIVAEETGYLPTHVVVRQEIWAELSMDYLTEDIVEVWELDGMKVSVSDYLNEPYEFLVNVKNIKGSRV